MALKRRLQEKLGEILLRQGAISDEQLKQAIEAQKSDGGLLGEVLVKLNFVIEHDIAKAIISQYGFPFISLENYDFNTDASILVQESFSRKNRLVPLDVVGDVLVVAMSNPLDTNIIADLESATGKKVQVFLIVVSSVEEALDKIYIKDPDSQADEEGS